MPTFFLAGTPQFQQPVVAYLIMTTAYSVLLTWAFLAGVVLLTVTAVDRWRTRRRDEPMGRRIVRRGMLTVIGMLALLQVAYPLAMAYVGTHRSPTPAAHLGSAYEAVELVAENGVVLRAGYLPSRNRAAIIVYPGRRGEQHAELLARHGYGVLLLEPRGQGGRGQRRRSELLWMG